MSKAELEKKQREFMEQAVRMAKKAGHGAEKNEMAEVSVPEPEIELPAEEIEDTAEEAAEEIAESAEELAEETEEITEELSEVFTEEAEDIAEEPPVFAESGSVKEEHAEETSYGVFDADELARAIEKGEVSGEGLRQAAEMLAEMTRKTEEMKKLIKEQENKSEKHANGGDIGLNSYIDRHNKGCRGCSDGKLSAP